MKTDLPVTSPPANLSVSSVPQTPSESGTSASTRDRGSYVPVTMAADTPNTEERQIRSLQRISSQSIGTTFLERVGESTGPVTVNFTEIHNYKESENNLGPKSTSALTAPVGGSQNVNIDRSRLNITQAVPLTPVSNRTADSVATSRSRSLAPVTSSAEDCPAPVERRCSENSPTETTSQPLAKSSSSNGESLAEDASSLRSVDQESSTDTTMPEEQETQPKSLYNGGGEDSSSAAQTTSTLEERPCISRPMHEEQETQPKSLYIERTEDGSSTRQNTIGPEEQPCTSQHRDQPIPTKRKADDASTPTNKRVKNEFSKIDVFKLKTKAKVLTNQSKYPEAYTILQQLQEDCGQGVDREVEWLVVACAAMSGVTESKEAVENFEKALCNELDPELNDLEELHAEHSQNKDYVESVVFRNLIARRLPEEEAHEKIPDYIQDIAKMKAPKKSGDILEKFTLPMLDSMAAVLYTGESELSKRVIEERKKAYAKCQYQIAILMEKNGHTDAVLKKTKFGKDTIAKAFGPRKCLKTAEYVQLELCEARAHNIKGETKQAKKQLRNAENHVKQLPLATMIVILKEVEKVKETLNIKKKGQT